MKKRKIFLNKNGEVLALTLGILGLLFGAMDFDSMGAFIISKIFSLIFLVIAIALIKYKKY